MAKRLTAVRKRTRTRNWIAYHCEALVASGTMSTWEAATYLTENLFGEKPNPRLLTPPNPHEITAHFLHYLYQPIVEAASREVVLSPATTLHLFTDISLTGNSAVLIVVFPGEGASPHLLMLEAVRAWDLVFSNAESFNGWVEERYTKLVRALLNTGKEVQDDLQKVV